MLVAACTMFSGNLCAGIRVFKPPEKSICRSNAIHQTFIMKLTEIIGDMLVCNRPPPVFVVVTVWE